MTLYNLHTSNPSGYRITKFDDNLVPVSSAYGYSSYILLCDDAGEWQCSCPAGSRPSCRHRDMLPDFLRQPDRIDSNWFLEYTSLGKGMSSVAWRQYVGPFADDGGKELVLEAEDDGTEEQEIESAPIENVDTYVSFPSDKSDLAIPQTTTLHPDPTGVPSFRRRV